MKALFKATEIHVQDLTNGKDVMVFDNYKDFDTKFPMDYYIVEWEAICSKAWVYVRPHDKATLAKLHISEDTFEEYVNTHA